MLAGLAALQKCFDLFDAERSLSLTNVDNRMAVGAYRTEVFYWINCVLRSYFRQWFDMMHMNKAFSDFAVCITKREAADAAPLTVVINALLAGSWIAFVRINGDSPFRSFWQGDVFIDLVREVVPLWLVFRRLSRTTLSSRPNLLSSFRCRLLRRRRYTTSVIVGEDLKYFVNLFIGLRAKMLTHTVAKIIPFETSQSFFFIDSTVYKTAPPSTKYDPARIIRRIALI